MSYIRYSSIYKYVEGESNDYIFCDNKDNIIDYGSCSNNTLVELFFTHFDIKDKIFKDYLLQQLAKKLNVKLRKKPLTDEEYYKLYEEQLKESDKWLETIIGNKNV